MPPKGKLNLIFLSLPDYYNLLSMSATHKFTSTSIFIVSMRAINNYLVNVGVQMKTGNEQEAKLS